MTELTQSEWDAFLESHPDAHLLQTADWGELKAGFGWRVRRVGNGASGVQVLFKPVAFGLSIAYIPKGPVGGDWAQLWPEVDALCRKEGAIVLKAEPDLAESDRGLASGHVLPGFIPSYQTIQPRRTIVISLEGSEEAILAQMKQKTRYNIHLATKKGVSVALSQDVELFSRMMAATGVRDGFSVHSTEYYRKAYRLFSGRDECALLVGAYENRPLAGLMVFRRGRRAWYLYGASSDEERQRMPTYLLQWEAMRWAKAHGCLEYDLWGIPDDDRLEEQFARRSDGLWGVYRFKRGFGGQVCRSMGAWDRVYRPGLYRLYAWVIARRRVALQG